MEAQASEMEKIAEADVLKHEVAETRTQIELDMKDSAKQSADAAGEVGLVKALWDTALSRSGKAKELVWKDIKATAAAGISFIPLVGEAGTLAKIGSAAKAGKEFNEYRKIANASIAAGKTNKYQWLIEKSLRKENFLNAIKNVPRNPVHLVSDPLQSGKEVLAARKGIKEIGKTADQVVRLGEIGALGGDPVAIEANLAGKLTEAQKAYGVAKKQFGKDTLISGALHVMHKIDPFPDVPPQLAMVAGLAEFVLPGANILPAVWQLGRNKFEWAKMYGGLAIDMGKVVMKRMDGKFNEAKKPDVMAAAGAFV